MASFQFPGGFFRNNNFLEKKIHERFSLFSSKRDTDIFGGRCFRMSYFFTGISFLVNIFKLVVPSSEKMMSTGFEVKLFFLWSQNGALFCFQLWWYQDQELINSKFEPWPIFFSTKMWNKKNGKNTFFCFQQRCRRRLFTWHVLLLHLTFIADWHLGSKNIQSRI